MDRTNTASQERQLALDILLEYGRHKGYSNILIRRALDEHPELTREQRSFVKRLAKGTIEDQIGLDARIRPALRDPSAKMKPALRWIMRMAVYEIYHMDSVTDYAAVNEAVQLLKAQGLGQLSGFVNAVLRRICREKAADGTVTRRDGKLVVVAGRRKAPTQASVGGEEKGEASQDNDDGGGTGSSGKVKRVVRIVKSAGQQAQDGGQSAVGADDIRLLSEQYSMPEEIVRLWLDDYGLEETKALLQGMQQIRPVCIRLMPDVSAKERDQLLEGMRQQGAEVRPGRWLPYAVQLFHAGRITELPGFREGRWAVQDESSMLVCEAAGLRQRQSPATVLDLCAAPGGKSLHAAALDPEGVVYSFDLTRSRTDRIRENAARLRCSNIVTDEHNAEEYNPVLEEKADVVLCDLPCSGLGVMTRKKDIKYGFSAGKIHSLVALQKRILKNAVHYVKPGGVLIYSTCTIDRAENDQMARFLARKLGLRPDPLAPFLPEDFPDIQGNYVQMVPQVHGTDGFFLARFVRDSAGTS